MKKYYKPFGNSLKQLLSITISVSLLLSPVSAYSASAAGDSSAERSGNMDFLSLIEEWEKRDHNLLGEGFEDIQNLIKAVREGKGFEFLTEYPGVKEQMDLFLLNRQKVEFIEHIFNVDEKRFIERVTDTIQLGEMENRPIYTICERVEVQYDEKSGTLIFKGFKNDKVVLRQYIPNMNIVGYANDKDILVILDRKKGLLLVDMLLARTYLGVVSIPVTKVPTPILKYLKKDELSTKEVRTVDVEFVNRLVRPPDVVPEKVEELGINFERKSFISAGDLMVSYTDTEGKKHLFQFMKRAEMAYWLNNTYSILNIMMQERAPYAVVNDIEGIENLIRKRMDFNTALIRPDSPNTTAMYHYSVASLFTKEALYKLVQAHTAMKSRTKQLSDLSPRDAMTFEEWQKSFEELSLNIPKWEKYFAQRPPKKEDAQADLFAKLRQSPEERSATGNILSTNNMFQLSKEPPSIDQVKKINRIAHIVKVIAEKSVNIGSWIRNNKFESSVYSSFLLIAFFYAFVLKQNYMDGSAFFQVTALSNLAIIGVLLPLFTLLTVTAGKTAFIKGLLKIFPHKEGLQTYLEEWKGMPFDKKIISLAFQFVGITIYPVYNYVLKSLGQPHFMRALQNGISPFKKIYPTSDIGSITGIKKPFLLGIQKPQYGKGTEAFHQQIELQDLTLAKKRRAQTVAWLMAVLALSQNKEVSPTEIIVFGMDKMDMEKLRKSHQDPALRMEIMWVMNNLLKEIRKMDEIDMRKTLSELEPEMIVRYYDRAKKLAEEMQTHSAFRKKVRDIRYTAAQFLRNRTVLGHFDSWQKIASINESESSFLTNNRPNEFQVERVIREFVPDHLLVALIPLSFTDRAELLFEHFNKLAMDPNGVLLSGGPHIQEVIMNLIAHFFISGGQIGILFRGREGLMQQAYEELKIGRNYEPRVLSSDPVAEKRQGMWNYYAHAVFDFVFKSQGKEDNLGKMAWNAYIARLKCIQMTFTLLIGFRLLFVENQVFSEALMGALFFHLAGYWMFGFPWDIIRGGARMTKTKVAENKKQIEDLQVRLSSISRGTIESRRTLFSEYGSVLKEVVQLYGFQLEQEEKPVSDEKLSGLQRQLTNSGIQEVNPELWRYLTNFNQDSSAHLPRSRSIKKIQNTSRLLIEFLSEKPPLPTDFNHSADRVLNVVFGAGLTTFLAIHWLSVLSFDKNYLNAGTIGMWAAINFAGYFLIYQFYTEGYFYNWFTKDTKIGRGLVRGKNYLWNPTKRWSLYFYENTLNPMRMSCQRIFSGRR